MASIIEQDWISFDVAMLQIDNNSQCAPDADNATIYM